MIKETTNPGPNLINSYLLIKAVSLKGHISTSDFVSRKLHTFTSSLRV